MSSSPSPSSLTRPTTEVRWENLTKKRPREEGAGETYSSSSSLSEVVIHTPGTLCVYRKGKGGSENGFPGKCLSSREAIWISLSGSSFSLESPTPSRMFILFWRVLSLLRFFWGALIFKEWTAAAAAQHASAPSLSVSVFCVRCQDVCVCVAFSSLLDIKRIDGFLHV